jgi:hypothetical protein
MKLLGIINAGFVVIVHYQSNFLRSAYSSEKNGIIGGQCFSYL